MKKYILSIFSLLLIAALYLGPAPAEAEAAEAPDITLVQIPLEETEKWILDEVLCDYISEDVVTLMDSDVDYTIGDWIDKTTHTYVFFEKDFPESPLYTACGYAQAQDGSYVYFELSSSSVLTETMVDLEIARHFGSSVSGTASAC